jgi:glycine/D-amino acid oxidase-like deaminating enzyme
MRVLTTEPLAAALLADGRGRPIMRTASGLASESGLISEIFEFRPNVLIVSPERLTGRAVDALARVTEGSWARVLCPGELNGHASIATSSLSLAGHVTLAAEPDQESVLRRLEEEFTRQVTFRSARELITGRGNPGLAGSAVILIGAGIVNLMSALALAELGCRVTVVERSCDPRNSGDWRAYGCTHGGQDARMYSVTEYDNYNEKGSSLYGGMREAFTTPVMDGGWLAIPTEALGERERQWNEMYQRVPAWLARSFTAEIYEIGAAAGQLWDELWQRIPQLRRGTGFCDGVLRTYADARKLGESSRIQASLGRLESVLDPEQLAKRYPGLSAACRSGAIIGGLEIRGFTVQIHAFVRALVGHLEERGVQFKWNCRARAFDRAPDGCIRGVDIGGEVLRARHYVACPGIYGNDILGGFKSRSLLHGVLGVWCTLPRLAHELTRSAKIKRAARINEDSNVTIAAGPNGDPVLILGTAYGYVGTQPEKLCARQLEFLYTQLEEVAQTFFPEAYREAKADGTLEASRRFCIRPWTPTGLGVFEVQAAEEGLAVVTGGHNTGGFAISPVVARSVAAALEGSVQDIHWNFHPERLPAVIPGLAPLPT